jgi:ribokinase
MILRETGQIIEMPAASVGPVVNTVGAGDALFSAFLHFYAKGYLPVDALQRAQVFAAHKIAVSGASNGFVTEQTVEDTGYYREQKA